MAKQKISSEDFMNLLADQESSPDVMAFKPKKAKAAKPTAPEDKLGPVQRELLEFALASAPTFFSRWVNRLRGAGRS